MLSIQKAEFAQCALALHEVVEERAAKKAIFVYGTCASVARSSDRQQLQHSNYGSITHGLD